MDRRSITSSNMPELSPPNAEASYSLRLDQPGRVYFQSTRTGFSLRYHVATCQMVLEFSSDSGKLTSIRASSMSKTGFTGSEIKTVTGFLQSLEEYHSED